MTNTISTLVASIDRLADAMLAGYAAGAEGEDDTLPEGVSEEWAEYYYRGYLEGAESRQS
jgi:hypothetical protein